MAIATKSRASKSAKSAKSAKSKTSRYIGKPAGIIQQRAETAGPSRFGSIAVDCAIQRSKWMLCDFFAIVLVEPTVVEHNAGSLRSMTSLFNPGWRLTRKASLRLPGATSFRQLRGYRITNLRSVARVGNI